MLPVWLSVPVDVDTTLGGPGSQSKDCEAKAMGWAGITSKAVGKEATPPYQQHCLTDHKLISWLCNDSVHVCVCLCVYIIAGHLEE